MILFLDKRTGFYYLTGPRESALSEDINLIPPNLRDNPNIEIDTFEAEEEPDVLTNMLNRGITTVDYENMPYSIDLYDLTYMNPNYAKYYMSELMLGKTSAKVMLWDEDLYMLVNIKEELKFIKTSINQEKYIITFADKTKAEEFLANLTGYDDFIPVRFKLDKSKQYICLDATPTILKNSERNQ